MGADCLMPIQTDPRGQPIKTRSDGTPYTIDDKEYWELSQNGGIRRYQHFEYPKTLYRGIRDTETKQVTYETMIAGTPREHEAFEPQGWVTHPAEAIEQFEVRRQAESKAAAEAAYAVQRMSEKARSEYATASATEPEHVTDVQPKPRRGRPPVKKDVQ